MTSTLFACYREPADRQAFDQHYADNHSALGLALPGLRSFTGTHPTPGADGSAPEYYLIGAGLASPQGVAAVADLDNFAGAGVDLMSGPSITYP